MAATCPMSNKEVSVRGQVVIDQHCNLTVHDAVVRGDLRVSGKIHGDGIQESARRTKFFRELTMDSGACIKDNEVMEWLDAGTGQQVRSVQVPVKGLYAVNVRVYDLGLEGSGISLWVNGIHTYSSANDEHSGTRAISSTQPFAAGDVLTVRSILAITPMASHRQAYTFQVAEL